MLVSIEAEELMALGVAEGDWVVESAIVVAYALCVIGRLVGSRTMDPM
jgi:hypothetical protein